MPLSASLVSRIAAMLLVAIVAAGCAHREQPPADAASVKDRASDWTPVATDPVQPVTRATETHMAPLRRFPTRSDISNPTPIVRHEAARVSRLNGPDRDASRRSVQPAKQAVAPKPVKPAAAPAPMPQKSVALPTIMAPTAAPATTEPAKEPDAVTAAVPKVEIIPPPTPVQPTPSRSDKVAVAGDGANIDKALDLADKYMKNGQIAPARAVLQEAARGESPDLLAALAATYDPIVLLDYPAVQKFADAKRAAELYEIAIAKGSAAAKERLAKLKLYMSRQGN